MKYDILDLKKLFHKEFGYDYGKATLHFESEMDINLFYYFDMNRWFVSKYSKFNLEFKEIKEEEVLPFIKKQMKYTKFI